MIKSDWTISASSFSIAANYISYFSETYKKLIKNGLLLRRNVSHNTNVCNHSKDFSTEDMMLCGFLVIGQAGYIQTK